MAQSVKGLIRKHQNLNLVSSMVVLAYNPSSGEAEAGGDSEQEASPKPKERPCLKQEVATTCYPSTQDTQTRLPGTSRAFQIARLQGLASSRFSKRLWLNLKKSGERMKKTHNINFTPPKAHTCTCTHTHVNMLIHALHTHANKNKENNIGNDVWLLYLSIHVNTHV